MNIEEAEALVVTTFKNRPKIALPLDEVAEIVGYTPESLQNFLQGLSDMGKKVYPNRPIIAEFPDGNVVVFSLSFLIGMLGEELRTMQDMVTLKKALNL